MKKKKILILCPSPKGTAATQRLKYEQYLGLLENEGYEFTISSFQSNRFWEVIYKPGRILEKLFWTFYGYLKRTFDLLRAPFYDGVFINLWVTPLGFPVYEKLISFMNPNIIYDIDDMIFLNDNEKRNEGFIQKLKGRRKPIVLMKNAKYVIVCTPKLEEIASKINKYKNVIDISSTFDTDRFIPVEGYVKNAITAIGWTGTHSTLPFLESIQPELAEVAKKRMVKLIVIANKEFKMKDVETEFIQWSAESEIQDLHRIEIGLYPIPANEWSLGKSSLKALTYMSIGIPFVATAYGTNFRVVEHGKSGYLAKSSDEWIEYLINLIDDIELRKTIGFNGRKRVEDLFSVKANFSKYLHVYKTVTP